MGRSSRTWFAHVLLGATLCACGPLPQQPEPPPDDGHPTPPPVSEGDPYDVPLASATADQEQAFYEGDDLFDLTLRDADGLGPLYTRASCGSCHDLGLRGPGSVQKMAASDPAKLPWGNTVHPLMTAGALTPIVPPADDPEVKVSIRVGPPILGRGYLEAVADSEILAQEAAQARRKDGIHGHVNRVVYASEPNPDPTFNAHRKGDVLIGRFGLKARIGTLDEFTADALQGDMGITSPLRPNEIPNPDGLTDDLKPGVDVTADSVNARAMYMRLTAIPKRDGLDELGRALFEDAGCDVCHVPSMKTRDDYPIAQLAGIDAPIFTDMLLHDLGDDLADGVVDGQASGREWRTAPLIALRFQKTFLHDGRARTVEDAILAHGGNGSEAAPSAAIFKGLPEDSREALIAFVKGL